jgi:hypothetical protein
MKITSTYKNVLITQATFKWQLKQICTCQPSKSTQENVLLLSFFQLIKVLLDLKILA